jgi:hypothetical protein
VTTTNAISHPSRSPLRRAARAGAFAIAVTVPFGPLATAPAVADTPAAWETPPPVPTLQALLIFVGIPALLFVVITLLAMAPSLIRGDRQQRGVASWTEPAWFGNQVKGEPERGEVTNPQSVAEVESSEGQSGGASARW